MASQATPPVATPPPPPLFYRRRRSWAGPIVLIFIGVIFLLKNLGYGFPLFQTWAKWWPLLLIIWGLVKLLEYMAAKRDNEPAPGIGGGGVLLLIFIIFFGLISTGILRVREHWGRNGPPGFVFNDDDLAQWFGNRYQYTQQVDQALPPDAKLTVTNDRGDVRVLVGNDDKLHVTLRKTVVASNQGDADRINTGANATINTAGNVVSVQWSGQPAVRADMDILLPRKGAVEVNAQRGDVSVTGRDGDLLVQADRGDVSAEDIKGSVTVHMQHGDLRAAKVTGSVSGDGRINDVTLADIDGPVSLTGDFFGDTSVNNVKNTFTFHSSRTDLSVAKVDGNLRLSGDSFDASQLTGPFRITTREKNVKLDQVAGDVHVQTTNGDVEIAPSKMGNIDVQDRNSDVVLRLPAGAHFQVDATADNGDASSDFSEIKVEKTGSMARLTGSTGNGGSRVQVSNAHADIAIRKQ